MPKHRVLFEFASMPGVVSTAGSDLGWTELWYDPADSTDDAAQTNAEGLLSRRRDLLTGGWRAVAIRISQLDNNNNLVRKGRLVQLAPAQGVGRYDINNPAQDEQAWDAVNLAIATSLGSRRAFLMRGIGNNVIGASGVYLAPPMFVIRSAAFATALRGDPGIGGGALTTTFALRTRSAPRVTNISGVFTANVANVNFVIDQSRPALRVPINTIAAGNQVSLIGVVDMPGMNGQWKAGQIILDPLNPNFNYVSLSPRRRILIKSAYTQGGVATYWNWTLDNITGFSVGPGSSRRTGRPPQQHRGRRSARRS